jgi:hypothetical protein
LSIRNKDGDRTEARLGNTSQISLLGNIQHRPRCAPSSNAGSPFHSLRMVAGSLVALSDTTRRTSSCGSRSMPGPAIQRRHCASHAVSSSRRS